MFTKLIELIKEKVQPQQVTEASVSMTDFQALLISAFAVSIGIIIRFPSQSNFIVGIIRKGTNFLLQKCRSKYPSTVDNLSKVLNGWFDKLLRYPSVDATNNAARNLKEKSDALKLELNKMSKGRKTNKLIDRFVKAMTGVASDTKKLSTNLQSIGKCPCVLLEIGLHAPLIGMAFATLIPALGAIESNYEVVGLIEESSDRIHSLIVNEICKLLMKVKSERITLNETETNELNTLLYTLEDGYSIIGGILQDRRKSFLGGFHKIGLHKERLEAWNRAVDEMLRADQRKRINMVFYRSRVALELARGQILLQSLTIIVIVFGFSLILKRLDQMDHVGRIINYFRK